MFEASPHARRDRGSIGPGMAVTLLVVALVQVGFGGGDIVQIIDGALVDTDAYMRLNRVRLLWETGAWLDSTYPRINPPQGLVQHWTRPMDLFLLLGALPLTLFMEFNDALHWWGVVTGPLLQVAFVFALVWAAAPLVGGPWRWLIALFSVAQPGILGNFVFGRPDHHGLLHLFLVILLGLALRLILEPERRRAAFGAGILAAACLWISLEAMPQVILTLAAFGLIWIGRGGDMLKMALVFSAALLAGLLLAILAEHGASAFSRQEFDRLSVVHLGLFGLNLVFWAWLATLGRRRGTLTGFAKRTAWSVLGVAGAGAVIWFALPQFLSNPVTREMEEVYRAVHHSGVVQLQPVLDLSPAEGFTWAGTVVRPLHWLGISLAALPWLVYLIASRPAAQARAWLLIALGCIAFLPAAILQARWANHAETFLLFPYAAFAAALIETISTHLRGLGVALVRPLAVIGLCVWFLVPTALTAPTTGAAVGAGTTAATPLTPCPLKPLSAALNDTRIVGQGRIESRTGGRMEGVTEGPKRVLAFIDFGPEILYRTPHSVYAIPTGRLQRGFQASYRIMTATEAEVARRLLVENGVDLIVVCPGSAEGNMYATENTAPTFYETLARGTPADFLRPLDLPADTAPYFKVFAVK